MDIYLEHLVKRSVNGSLLLFKILVIAGSLVLGVGLLLLLMLEFYLGSVGILLLIFIIWGGWALQRNTTELEYEYIVTGYTMDVDKIIAQRKRKRVCTVDLHEVDQYGRCDEAHRHQVESAQVSKRADASTHVDGETWYLIANTKKFGRTLLLFSPDEKILDMMKTAQPRALQ